MNRLMLPCLGVALAMALLVAGCGKPKVAALPRGATVLALGDSLTYGTGATPETSYPSHLASATRWTVVNGGIPGDTAQQGCDRLAPLLDEHRPALVLVFLGGNDFLRMRPPAALKDGLQRCITAARAAAIPLVLLAVPTLGLSGFSDASLYGEFAKAANVAIASPGLGALLRDDALRADAIHLNGDGYRALATNVAGELRRLGYLSP